MSPECHISFFHLTHTNITLTHYKSNKILVLPIKGSITFRSAPLTCARQYKVQPIRNGHTQVRGNKRATTKTKVK